MSLPRHAAAIALALALLIPVRGGLAREAHALPTPPREPVLRIALAIGVPALEISSAGEMRVWRRGSGLAPSPVPSGQVLRLSVVTGGETPAARLPAAGPPTAGLPAAGGRTGVSRGGEVLGAFDEELLFEPRTPGQPLCVDGRSYRGEILVRRGIRGGLDVINAVGIEDYLCGVVPLEIGSGDAVPASALRAQAIAARSYSLHYLGRRATTHGCDLLATIEDQVYGGESVETPAATRAVLETRGTVAVHGGRPIRANYCSTCGGRTASSGEAWPGDTHPYLRSTRDDGCSRQICCGASRHARWEECWDCDLFADLVLRHLPDEAPEARGKALGRLLDVRVVSCSASGRAAEVRVLTEGGQFTVRSDRIRWLLRRPDGAPLRSTLIGQPRRSERGGACQVCLEGRGNGHGVGMCQSGALERARLGASAEEILRHYYRGIELVPWW